MFGLPVDRVIAYDITSDDKRAPRDGMPVNRRPFISGGISEDGGGCERRSDKAEKRLSARPTCSQVHILNSEGSRHTRRPDGRGDGQ